MLKKIQNLWNSILIKKKLSNNINLYSIKHYLLFTNAISHSLIFYILDLKNLKSKKLKTLNNLFNFFNFYNIVIIAFLIIWVSFIIFLLFLN